jgi:hypothetical protein
MKRLVSPEGTLFLVPDRQSLDGIITRLGLDPVHAGNLRQLCDFVSIGADGRSGAKRAGDWCLLEHVKWLRRDDSDSVLAAIGSHANATKTFPQLRELSESQRKQLFGKKGAAGKWKRLEEPAGVFSLASGASLHGRRPSLVAAGRSMGGGFGGGLQVGEIAVPQ